MNTLPEQFSAASKSGIEAQLDFFKSFGAKACDGAARLIALNLDTGRATVDSSSAALRQLASLQDPRDLFALAKTPHQDFERMMAYGREWLSIVADVQAGLLKPLEQQAPAAQAPAAPAAEAAPEERSVKPGKQPVVALKPEAEPEPVAEPTPIAKAAGTVAGITPDATPAAVMPESPEVVPHLKPAGTMPPPVTFQQELLTPRRGGKKR
ncbi:MAG: TIGR01841 family phasin [Telluria sp.]